MKKIFIVLAASIVLLTGCGASLNTPTGAVEEFLSKYQNLDKDVLAQLDSVIANDNTMSEDQRSDYRDLMITQYKNLSYKVKDENIVDDEAEVDVEIEVLDYASNINESRIYFRKHTDEFNDKDNNGNTDSGNNGIADDIGEGITDAIDNISSFIEYKIKNLKDVTNTTTYTITFYLTKIDNEWVVEDMSDVDIQKIHGLYEG